LKETTTGIAKEKAEIISAIKPPSRDSSHHFIYQNAVKSNVWEEYTSMNILQF
jgi:hypothetical protein